MTTLNIAEADWQATVIAAARLHGWMVAHFRPARTEQGWRTPVAADGKGFPDLLMVRDRVVAAELKSARGRVTADQGRWLATFEAAGVETHVWRPDDFDEVVEVLGRRA